MVIQSDFAWQEQTGAPDDPQPGNANGTPYVLLAALTFKAEEAYLFKNARRMTFGPQFLLQMVRSERSNADATIV
jgi:hypothetical protein